MNADRRKQMKSEYKSKAAVGAVYAIACSGNQRRWIKSTVDIEGIRNRFRFAMNIKACPDPAMCSEWNEFGPETFSLVVLEEIKNKEGQSAKEFAEDVALLYEMWMEKQPPAQI